MHLGYIDPAQGSMLLQIILGGVAAMAVALKMWWRRVLRLLHIRKPEDDEEAEPASNAYQDEAAGTDASSARDAQKVPPLLR
jgi:hypothetical protein